MTCCVTRLPADIIQQILKFFSVSEVAKFITVSNNMRENSVYYLADFATWPLSVIVTLKDKVLLNCIKKAIIDQHIQELKSPYNSSRLYTDVLPMSLTHLSFMSRFNQRLISGILPPSLTHLAFGMMFNQDLDEGVLPTSLTHLTFGYGFNRIINRGILPKSLKYLEFGSAFNQALENLPPALTHLIFKHNFDQKIRYLPSLLTHLTFGDKFNQELTEGILPVSLTHLEIGKYYNKPLNYGALPASLKSLTFVYRPDKYYPKIVLPDFLTDLIFEGDFDVLTLGVLPLSLTRLSINRNEIYREQCQSYALVL